MSQAIQKCIKLTKHPNFRKKIEEAGVCELSKSLVKFNILYNVIHYTGKSLAYLFRSPPLIVMKTLIALKIGTAEF